MDIKALRYFVTAVKYGSVTQAAFHLHVAQPAVSRQLRKLETELGVQLLKRTAQGISLTGPGLRLMARAEVILQSLERARAEVETWDREPSGPVSVALMPAIGSLVAPALVRALRERYPKVSLHLSEGLSTFISDGVLRGQFDLGLLHAHGELPNLSIGHLLDEPMFLVGPGGGDPAVRTVSMKKLAEFPLFLPSLSSPLRRMVDKVASEHGITLNVREIVDGSLAMKGLILAGLGYTVQCYSYVHAEVQRGDVSIRLIKAEGLTRSWSLASRVDALAVPAVNAVKVVIEEIAADLSRTHNWHPPSSTLRGVQPSRNTRQR